MTKWEYRWVRPGELSPRLMNNLGDDGWEFVGTLGGDWAIFKRPDPDWEAEQYKQRREQAKRRVKRAISDGA